MSGLVQITAPTVEPVSLVEAKQQLRIESDFHEDDTLISSYITAARVDVELYLRRSLINQTWDLFFDEWPDNDELLLRRAPLVSVTGVYYTPESGVETEWASSNYIVSTASLPGRVKFKRSVSVPGDTLQEIDGVRVRYVAGYGSAASDVPQNFRQAIRLVMADMYENREDTIVAQGVSVVEQVHAAKRLLIKERVDYR